MCNRLKAVDIMYQVFNISKEKAPWIIMITNDAIAALAGIVISHA
jgi:hypothetical protein